MITTVLITVFEFPPRIVASFTRHNGNPRIYNATLSSSRRLRHIVKAYMDGYSDTYNAIYVGELMFIIERKG